MDIAENTASDPFDLAYEAFVADCLAEGIDPNSEQAFALAADPYADWRQDETETDDTAHLRYAPTIEW